MVDLQLSNMADRHPGLTPNLANALAEAARVCLDRHHQSPADFSVSCKGQQGRAQVEFEKPDPRMIAANANDPDATRDAAYSISFAAVERLEEMVVVARAEAMSGADWYIAPVGTAVGDLEDAVRLEVSGTDLGDSRECQRRLLQKVAQTQAPGHPITAIASVVGLKSTTILIADCPDG